MGWTFAIVSGVASTATQSVFSSLVDSMSSYWFIFTMAAEMAVTLYLVGRSFPRIFRWLVAIQIGHNGPFPHCDSELYLGDCGARGGTAR